MGSPTVRRSITQTTYSLHKPPPHRLSRLLLGKHLARPRIDLRLPRIVLWLSRMHGRLPRILPALSRKLARLSRSTPALLRILLSLSRKLARPSRSARALLRKLAPLSRSARRVSRSARAKQNKPRHDLLNDRAKKPIRPKSAQSPLPSPAKRYRTRNTTSTPRPRTAGLGPVTTRPPLTIAIFLDHPQKHLQIALKRSISVKAAHFPLKAAHFLLKAAHFPLKTARLNASQYRNHPKKPHGQHNQYSPTPRQRNLG